MLFLIFGILKAGLSHGKTNTEIKNLLENQGSCKKMPFPNLVDISSGSLPSDQSVDGYYACNGNMNRIDAPMKAIFFYHCTFSNINGDNKNGGAIFVTTKSKNPNNKLKPLEIHYCTFDNCNANCGGAIYFATSQNSRAFNVINCIFNNNKASSNGGAIYFTAINGTFENNQFNNNVAIKGTAIYFNHNSTSIYPEHLIVQNNKFVQNQQESIKMESIVFVSWTNNKMHFLNNQILIKNVNDLYLLGHDGSAPESKDFVIKSNCISSLDLITKSESLKSLVENADFTDDCLFIDDSTSCPSYTESENLIVLEEGQEYESDGNKIVYGCDKNLKKVNADECLLHIYNCKFSSLSLNVKDDGGAIYIVTYSSTDDKSPTPEGEYEIYHCSFDHCGNSDILYGGAIYFESQFHERVLKISDCSFDSNTALSGGAIYLKVTVGIIEKCKFTNNIAIDGCDISYAQLASGTSNEFLTICHNTFLFDNCNKIDEISEILHIKWHCNSGINFNNNDIEFSCSVTSIYFLGYEKENEVNPTKDTMIFSSNYITKDLSIIKDETIKSIILENENPFITEKPPVEPTNPTNPTPPPEVTKPDDTTGPSVPSDCPEKPTGTVDDLSSNPTKYQDNSIIYGCNLDIKQRINGYGHSLNIYSCRFDGLRATGDETGGCIYIFTSGNYGPSKKNITIEKCSFKNNHASKGGAISISSAQITRFFNINHCKFENNEAETDGGSIYFNAVFCTIEHCDFHDNKASNKGNEIYFVCKENKNGNSPNPFTIQNNKFEINEKSSSSIIYLNWTKECDFVFNSNEIIITSKDEIYLFESTGDLNGGSMTYSSNCISPSLNSLCNSNNDALLTKLKPGFSITCPITDPTNPTNPTNPTTPPEVTKPDDTTGPSEPSDCPEKPTGTVDDLSNNPTKYQDNSIIYGCNLDIKQRINGYGHSLNIYSCRFDGLRATGDETGGCIYIFTSGKYGPSKKNITIEKCSFKNNHASKGGAISISSAQITRFFNINHCKFENNEAETDGGSIYFNAVFCTIEHCDFHDNKASNKGNEIYFVCKENKNGNSPNPFTIQNNKFEINEKSSSSIIYLNWTKECDFVFNSNEIIITSKDEIYLFESTGDLNGGSMTYSSNCISPSLNLLCNSNNEELLTKLKSGFSNSCPTSTPTNPIENTHTPLPVDDLTVDDSFSFGGETIELTKNGFIADSKEHTISNKNSDVYLIHSQENSNLIKISTTHEKPEKHVFVSPNKDHTTALVLLPLDGSNDFGLGEIGIHANTNIKNIILPKENVPLNLYNNKESDITFSFEKTIESSTLSLNNLIINDGSLQMKIPEGIEKVEFNSIEAYKNDQLETIRDNEQIEINVNQLKLNRGSQLTLMKFNISNVIKSGSQSKLIIENKATFSNDAKIELMESSLIDFGSSIIDGTCKEIRLFKSEESRINLQDEEKSIPLICGSNFNCKNWKENFIGNDEYKYAKCINKDNKVCLAATNKIDSLNNNNSKNKGLPTGGIIGIVLAVVVVVAVAIVVAIILIRKKANNPEQYKDAPSQEVENLSVENNQNQNQSQQYTEQDVFQNKSDDQFDPFLNEFDDNSNNENY